MKDFMKSFKKAFEKGIVLWIFAHLLLYVVGAYKNDLNLYNAQIDKLHDPLNFLLQLAYSGLLYSALEVTFTFFVDNIFKYAVKGDRKRLIVNVVIALVLMGLVSVTAYAIKKMDIVNKNILKLMIVLLMVKGGVGIVSTVKDNTVYNSKLQEKNRE